jgi:hypothetical protein
MADEFLGDRKKALEDSFFAKENAKLVERLRAEKEKTSAREGLAQVTGISDAAVVQKLVDLGIKPETWAAVSLLPLIEVAWADGNVDDKERRAVLAAAEANGIAAGSPSSELLENWLVERPDSQMLEAWGGSIATLCAALDEREKQALKAEVVGRARTVAEAAGGILGLGNKVSAEEAEVLSRLERAFGP